jgi:hypothetical protein
MIMASLITGLHNSAVDRGQYVRRISSFGL